MKLSIFTFIFFSAIVGETIITSILGINYVEINTPTELSEAANSDLLVNPNLQGISLETEPEIQTLLEAVKIENIVPVPTPTSYPDVTRCVISGCNDQICGERSFITTCEIKPVYACYSLVKCEVQPSGECGWTKTEEFNKCYLQ